jgi:hypothetical protein
MKKKQIRGISGILALSMVLSLGVPCTAYGEENENQQLVVQEEGEKETSNPESEGSEETNSLSGETVTESSTETSPTPTPSMEPASPTPEPELSGNQAAPSPSPAVSQDKAAQGAMLSETSLESLDTATGNFVIRVKGVSAAAGIQKVQVPVWSHKNQDDLVWYDAVKDGSDYVVQGSLGRHQYHMGTYQVNVYITDKNGTLYGFQAPSFSVSLQYDTFQIIKAESNTEYTAELSGLKGYGAVKEVLVAVWSENGGQDDLLWYSMQGSDPYTKQIFLKDHRGYGSYQVHCYASLKDGSMVLLQTAQFDVPAPSIQSVTAQVTDKAKGEFEIRVKGAAALNGVATVQIPVWCASDQSDLVWYTAEKEGSDYVVRTSVKSHGSHMGTYQINVYLTDKNGLRSGVGATVLEMNMQYGNLTAKPVQDSQKQYRIELTGLEDYGLAEKVLFAVWSESGGQDDLIWYTADVSSGAYYKVITIADFKSVGTYQVHSYAQAEDGAMTFLGSTTLEVDAPACTKVSQTADKNSGDFQITVEGVTAAGGVQKVQIPVWCASDQSDLVWYTAAKKDGAYVVSSNISKHKNHTGTYQFGVYVTDGNGMMTGVTSSTIDLKMESGKFLPVESFSDGLYYRAELENPHFYGQGEKVLFAVWSEKGGQDDLVWYDTVKKDGNYYVNIPMANHMTAGLYYVNAYVQLKDGSMQGLLSTTFQVEKVPQEKIVISEVNGERGTFEVAVYLLRKESQISSVQVPVWCASDQSDLVWYQAKKDSEGVYHVSVDIQDHDMHFGKYQVHAYVKDKDGNMHGVTTTSVDMNADNYVVQKQISDSVYMITVYGANANGQKATSVQFPTWSEAGNQDDLVWYEGKNDGNGNYTVTIYRKNHKRNGDYITHIYVYSGSAMEGLATKPQYRLSTSQKFDAHAKEVMHNIIYAVETGGQIYGNARYNDFTEAYTNSYKETAITIGAGAWFATEAKNLLSLIREADPLTFAKLDTAGIGYDLDTADWSTYGGDGNGNPTILKGSAKALCIQSIISTDTGIAMQDSLVDEQMEKYVNEAEDMGVTDLKARMFCANIRHLGGKGAMEWVIEVCAEDGKALTMENLWTSMRDHTPNKDGNGVGADKYKSRHEKVMKWLNEYIG